MKAPCPDDSVEQVRELCESAGFTAHPLRWAGRTALRLEGRVDPDLAALIAEVDGVERVFFRRRPLVQATAGPAERHVRLGGCTLGPGRFAIIAGPCAVESEAQLMAVARAVREAGADALRGGAFKPRTSPYDFQGLGPSGLKLLARARAETGLAVVTEAVDESSFARVEECADAVQIGARNMQNYALLKRAGRSRLPIVLKRGMSASLEEWLHAAEYILDGGNPHVVLCERGIRTFDSHSRYTLDLSVVPALRRISHLPVLVDPSHASGDAALVPALARAALAVGADGVMIEVHPEPLRALCDGPQSLRPEEFATLALELRALAVQLMRPRETVS